MFPMFINIFKCPQRFHQWFHQWFHQSCTSWEQMVKVASSDGSCQDKCFITKHDDKKINGNFGFFLYGLLWIDMAKIKG